MKADNLNLMPRMVKICWQDVMSAHTALLTEEDLIDFQPVNAHIVGFLVKETDDCYYIAKEWWESGQFKYLHIIPKKTAIMSIDTLYEAGDNQ